VSNSFTLRQSADTPKNIAKHFQNQLIEVWQIDGAGPRPRYRARPSDDAGYLETAECRMDEAATDNNEYRPGEGLQFIRGFGGAGVSSTGLCMQGR
jgi:hypothetical protein